MANKQKDEETQDNIEEVEEIEETVEAVEEEEEGASLDDEATEDIIEEVEEDHSSLLASLGADLEFLHGDNMSFYQANKAYYEDRNYEEAITGFQAAIEHEKSQAPNLPEVEESEDSEDSTESESPNEIIAKSMYWIGEAYLKLDQIDQAVKTFGELSSRYEQHYLAPAAERRIASLTLDEESESA